jgi:hypothetical protein
MTGLMIERAKPLAERIDFLNKTQSIHRSDSRSSLWKRRCVLVSPAAFARPNSQIDFRQRFAA